MSIIGNRIRQARLLRGLSQPALAEISGVQQTTISNIETGKHDARSASITALAQALNVTRGWLYGETGGDPTDALTEAVPKSHIAEDSYGYDFSPAVPDITPADRERFISSTKEELQNALQPMNELLELLKGRNDLPDPHLLKALRDGVNSIKNLLNTAQNQ
ncbi:MAG: helix-turn-helix domain-containing protein [Chloroflexi bacterium]|nr:helix-turn-helix domain-containing protein [Chloroflexota bacterium]